MFKREEKVNINKVKIRNSMVLVKPFEKKKGIIEIVGEVAEFDNKGEVVLVGAEVKSVKTGEEVVFAECAGEEVELGEKFLLMSADSILAVVEKV